MNPVSLDDRFQGAFLGIVLGHRLGRLQPGSGPWSPDSSHHWGELIPRLTQNLIEHPRLNLSDYWKIAAPGEGKPQPEPKPTPPQPQECNSGSEVAVGAFPLALFFHDNFNALQQLGANQPEQVAPVWDGVLAMARAIAQILTQNPELDQLIPNLLQQLPIASALTAQLEQVQTLLQQKASLETAVRQLTQTPSPQQKVLGDFEPQNWTALALGFYCFLSTPEDYALTVLRSLQTRYHPEITAAISGALSGAYQGLIAIPVKWRLELSDPCVWPLTHPEIENNPVQPNPTQGELLQLAQNLFALWSGVYRP